MELYKEEIRRYIRKYLAFKKFPVKNYNTGLTTFKCFNCGKIASINSNRHIAECMSCHKKYDIVNLVRELEREYDKKSEEEILNHLKELLKIKVMTPTDVENLDGFLDYYVKCGFDLVPIVANQKYPIEKDWTNKEHKDKTEWLEWIKNGLNIGVKTGKRSEITIIDIDQKPIPSEIDSIKGNCVIQESTNGFHLIYKYVPELPKTRIDELKVDIENDGGQVVIYPSTINEVQRKFIKITDNITTMPEELKTFLSTQVTVPRKTDSEKVKEDIETEDFNLGILGQGQRNSSLVRLGGLFRKELNINQTKYILSVLNRTLCKSPLPQREINAMIGSIDKYTQFDEKELAHKILDYLRKIEEANRTEIAMAVVATNRGEDKKRVDEALQYLVKEGHILKKGRSYGVIQKANWKTNLINVETPINFKMPYFENVMNFNWGDLILIGSGNARGKTHISMNIIKQLVKQGKNPYYLSLESGSRFIKIALQLGLKEPELKYDEVADATKIELELDEAITVIDWLCPNSYAEVDKLLMHFTKQLQKTKGIAIVFMQLRDNNEWLAKDLVKQFPAFACRYIYDKDSSGEYGKFMIDKIRDPKIRINHYEIPCKYDWVSKELIIQEEIEKEKENETRKENK